MIIKGRSNDFKLECRLCDITDLERKPAETNFEDFRVSCPECGGVATVEDDAGIIKTHSLGDADIRAKPV